MSRIDDLIAQLCPGGVPVKPLAEIGQLVRGNGLPKADFTETGVGAIHYGQIYTYYSTWATETISFVAPETAARLAKVDPGDVIITNTSENLEDVGKAVAWLGSEQIVTGGHATVLKHSENPRFIAYWLQTPEFLAQKKRLATGTKVIDVSAKALERVQIPVPPPAIQDEIVSILDKMSRLKSELESELELRARQYEHYRDSLLAFSEAGAVRWVPIGDLASVRVGQAPDRAALSQVGAYPFVNAGTTASGRISEMNTEGGTVTIPSRGQGGVGIVGYQPEDFWCGPLCYRIRSTSVELDTHFLYYYLKSVQPSIRALQQTGGTPALNRKELVLVPVPLPSLDEQHGLVSILKKFDALASDLSFGLPAEINARRQQYEYYRDRLLKFKEAVA